MKHILSCILIFIILIPVPGISQVTIAKLNLNQYIQLVLKNNTAIKSESALIARYHARKKEHAAMYGPEANVNLRFFPDIDEYGLNRRYRSNITVAQPVWTKRKRRSCLIKQSEAQAEHAKILQRQKRNEIIYDAATLYLNTVIAGKEVAFLRQVLDVAQKYQTHIQQRRKEREARALDLLEAEKLILKLKLELKEANENHLFLLEHLKKTTGVQIAFRELEPEWIAIPAIPDSIRNLSDSEILKIFRYYRLNLNDHYDIKAYDQLMTIESIEKELSGLYYPDLNISASYNLMGRDHPFERDSWGFRLWASFPLFYRTLEKSRAEQQQAAWQKLSFDRETRKNELLQEIRQAVINLEQMRNRKLYLEKQKELALEKVRITEAAKLLGQDNEKYMFKDILIENYESRMDLITATKELELWPYHFSLLYLEMLWLSGFTRDSAPFFETRLPQLSYEKALWVYDKSWTTDSAAFRELAAFCRDQQISRIFLSTGAPHDSRSIFNLPEIYGNLLTALQENGIQVQLLLGDGSWCKSPYSRNIMDRIDRLLEFYSTYSQFWGFHFDIEPHTLNEWKQPGRIKDTIIQNYLTLLRKLYTRIKSVNAEIKVNLDIPFWYEKERLYSWAQDENLLTNLIEYTDELTIMTYKTDAGQIIRLAKEELLTSRIHQKPLWLGLKVKTDEHTHSNDSFAPLGTEVLGAVMNDIYLHVKDSYPEFRGFSFYHYQGYRQLKK